MSMRFFESVISEADNLSIRFRTIWFSVGVLEDGVEISIYIDLAAKSFTG